LIFAFHAGLDEFVEDPEDEYDLIVSNPPFIQNYKTEMKQRDLYVFKAFDLIEAATLCFQRNILCSVFHTKKKVWPLPMNELY
jgi:tRNA1Val (adenine37-N6)-methyltransferase